MDKGACPRVRVASGMSATAFNKWKHHHDYNDLQNNSTSPGIAKKKVLNRIGYSSFYFVFCFLRVYSTNTAQTPTTNAYHDTCVYDAKTRIAGMHARNGAAGVDLAVIPKGYHFQSFSIFGMRGFLMPCVLSSPSLLYPRPGPALSPNARQVDT